MKKTILLIVVLLGLCRGASFAGDGSTRTREVKVLPFDKLIIAANITVVLYENPDASTVIVQGKANYAKRVTVLQKEDRLVITSGSGAHMREKVTVYVPVNKLKSLEVNESAMVKSQNILQSPGLEIRTDGLCEVNIIVKGAVKVKEGEHYTFLRRIRPEQAMLKLAAPVYY